MNISLVFAVKNRQIRVGFLEKCSFSPKEPEVFERKQKELPKIRAGTGVHPLTARGVQGKPAGLLPVKAGCRREAGQEV